MSDKWGTRLFKTGAVWLVIVGLVHATSLFRAPVPANDIEKQLLGLMSTYRFDVLGTSRSMSELLQGFSVAFMLAALGVGVLDLLLARERAGLLKRVALVNMIWLAAMTADSLRYFFVLPVTFLATGLLIFGLAWLKLPAETTSWSGAGYARDGEIKVTPKPFA
jgi:hypothetical protein